MPGGRDGPGGLLRVAVRVRVPLREGRPRGPRLRHHDGIGTGPALPGDLGGGRLRPGPVGGDGPGPRCSLEIGPLFRTRGGDVVVVPRPGVIPGSHQRRVRGPTLIPTPSSRTTVVPTPGSGPTPIPTRGGTTVVLRAGSSGGPPGPRFQAHPGRAPARRARRRHGRGIPSRIPVGGVPAARDGIVAAQGLLRRAGREAGQHDAPVLAHQHRPHRDVPVRPPVRVQHAQRGQYVRGHFRRPVRAQRLVGDQRRQRPRRDQFAHDPQRPALGEHVEDLVEPRMVGDRGRRLRGLDGAPYGRQVRRVAAPRRRQGARPVQQLRVHDFRQRHLPDQDFLPAPRVEGTGLDQLVLVRRRQRQAVPVGQDPARVLLHIASPEYWGHPRGPADTIRRRGRPRPEVSRAIGRYRRRWYASACTRGRPTGRRRS